MSDLTKHLLHIAGGPKPEKIQEPQERSEAHRRGIAEEKIADAIYEFLPHITALEAAQVGIEIVNRYWRT